MKAIARVLAFGLLALSLSAQSRKTVYVDKMEGLEPFVEQALQNAELPFEFVEEAKRPELKATLAQKHSAYAEILYKNKLGRNEDHVLELVEVDTGKVLASYSFAIKADAKARERIAAAFAQQVKKKLKP
ncbi:MAG: hypothetical protein OHK0021_19760 [Bryobacter sp.]